MRMNKLFFSVVTIMTIMLSTFSFTQNENLESFNSYDNKENSLISNEYFSAEEKYFNSYDDNKTQILNFEATNEGSISLVDIIINNGEYLFENDENIWISFYDKNDEEQDVFYKTKSNGIISDYKKTNNFEIDRSTLIHAPEYEDPENNIVETFYIPEIRFSLFDSSEPIKLILEVDEDVIFEKTLTLDNKEQFIIEPNSFKTQRRTQYNEDSKLLKLSFNHKGKMPNDFDPQEHIDFSEQDEYLETSRDIRVLDREEIINNNVSNSSQIEQNIIYIEVPNNLMTKDENKLDFLTNRFIFNGTFNSDLLEDYENRIASGIIVNNYFYSLPIRFWFFPSVIGLLLLILLIEIYYTLKKKYKIFIKIKEIEKKVDDISKIIEPHFVSEIYHDYLASKKLTKKQIVKELENLKIEFDKKLTKSKLLKFLTVLDDEEIKRANKIIKDEFLSLKDYQVKSKGKKEGDFNE